MVTAGTTTVIIGTAGTEQKGPHMVDGEHKFVMEYAADKIARGLGKTLVAPVITYVPEGSWENPGGHMGKPGTITLPEDRFIELLVDAGRSLKSGGFTTILFLGESGGNQNGMRDGGHAAERAAGRATARRRSGSATTTRRATTIRTRTSRRRWAFPPTRSAGTRTCSTRPRCCSSTRSTCARTSSRRAAAIRTAASAAIRRSRRPSSARSSFRSRSTTRWRRSRG